MVVFMKTSRSLPGRASGIPAARLPDFRKMSVPAVTCGTLRGGKAPDEPMMKAYTLEKAEVDSLVAYLVKLKKK
jgi:hypothetical protein